MDGSHGMDINEIHGNAGCNGMSDPVAVLMNLPQGRYCIVKILEEYWVLAPREIEVVFSPIDVITWVLTKNK